MRIHSYVLTFPDEADLLSDALNSLSGFSDHIYLVDGGLGEKRLCWRPRYTTSIKEWLTTRPEFSGYGTNFFTLDSVPWSKEEIEAFKKVVADHPIDDREIVVAGDMTLEICGVTWNGVPITVWEHELITPGGQRNWILNKMLQEPEQPDWVCWIDSDEICTNEFIKDVRPYLESLPPDVSNIVPKWLTLVEDEQHYAPSHSNYLSHARMHHPGVVNWGETWHEHQFYVGIRMGWDRYIVHTRMLYRTRLFVQRTHITLTEGGWPNVTADLVPPGISWSLHWPEGEPAGMPFDADIRKYEGGKYCK